MHDHHSDNPAHDHEHGCGNHCAGHDHEGGCACHAQEPDHESQPHRCHHAEIIATLTKERDEYLAGWQRAKADYQNLMKATEKAKGEWMVFSYKELFKQQLEVMDFFRYAFSHKIPEGLEQTEWFKGIVHIRDSLLSLLKQHGLKEIPTLGKPFDPHLHEAVEEVESDQAPGTIVEELTSGFTLQDQVLRPAKVKVAKEHPTSS